MTFSKMEKIGMGIALCIVVGLFILMKYYDGLFRRVDTVLTENFADPPTLTIYDKSGINNVVINNKVMFYRDDDQHTLVILYPQALADTTFNIELMDLSAKTTTELYNQSSPNVTLSTDKKRITLKVTLVEKTSYKLSVIPSASTTPVTDVLSFETGPHTFFYGSAPVTNIGVTSTSIADRNMCLAISLATPPLSYKFNNTDAQNLNPGTWPNNSITYLLRKPDPDEFKIYTIQSNVNRTQDEILAARKTLESFDEYMPYAFDIQLEFYRSPDGMPNEKINKPDINCKSPCDVTISGLREGINYTLKSRLVYFKAGTQNYRSTPVLETTFRPTDIQANDFQLLGQIKQLLKSVKDQTVNINEFNKYQIEQDKNLDDLEARFDSKNFKF